MVAWDKVKGKLFVLCSDSSAHGISNIFRTKRRSFKFIWLVFLMIFTVICLLLIIRNIIDYSKYPITTKVNYPTINEAEFPSIAICNSNPFITGHSIQRLFHQMNIYNFSNDRNQSKLSILNEMLISNNTLRSQILRYAYNMNDTLKKLASFPLNEILISCKFKHHVCNHSDFDWFWSYTYGNCFVINSIKKKFSNLNVQLSGPINALELEIFSGFENLIPVFDVSQGFVVMVFNKNQGLEFNSNFRFTLARVGAETNIAMNRIKVKKLPRPYSRCDFDIRTSSIDTFESSFYKVTF